MYEIIKSFFIPGNVPSSKNSRILNTKTKRSFPSKTVSKWRKQAKDTFIESKNAFLENLDKVSPPYLIGFHFVRNSNRSFDYVNPLQTIQDEMVKYEWIEDDNISVIVPIIYWDVSEIKNYQTDTVVNKEYYSVDKSNPGVYIFILNNARFKI